MSQSRSQSLAETCTNTGVGMVGSFIITLSCMTFIPGTVTCTTVTVLGCTAWSVARGYVIRRWYNGKAGQRGPEKAR